MWSCVNDDDDDNRGCCFGTVVPVNAATAVLPVHTAAIRIAMVTFMVSLVIYIYIYIYMYD